ncbi:hypothetical protein RI367_007466 [Sorochytrium milnesiophthora]
MLQSRTDPTTVYLTEEGQIGPLQAVVRLSASLSFVGTVAVATHITRNWRELKTSPHRIVLWWTIADMLLVPFMEISRGVMDNQTACTVQGMFIHYSLLASVCWGASLATNVLMSVVFQRSMLQLMEVERYYHMLAWTLPALSLVIPMSLPLVNDAPVFGDAQLWCWISRQYGNYRMAYFYGPAMAVFAYCLVVYLIVGLRVWRSTEGYQSFHPPVHKVQALTSDVSQNVWQAVSRPSTVRQKYAFKTSLYIFAFLLTWTFGITNRIRTLLYPTAMPNIPLFTLHAFFMPAQGFLNAIVYFAPIILHPFLHRRAAAATARGGSTDPNESVDGTDSARYNKTSQVKLQPATFNASAVISQARLEGSQSMSAAQAHNA